MKVGKPKSKRVPVRLRHKIEKASAAKQQKQRKEAKKNPQWRSRLKKDPGIPNLFPYKAKVLADIEDSKRRKEEEVVRRREIAKAQRQGTALPVNTSVPSKGEEGEDEDEDEDVSIDDASDLGEDGDESMDEQDSSNPMAALLASAQARADVYPQPEANSEDEDDEEDDQWNGIDDTNPTIDSTKLQRQGLPKQAISDPIKTVSKLLDQLQDASGGIRLLLDHYEIPPLVTAGSDLNTRFLVEVARKRGRLGRGGIPNLHSAALTVLGDVHDGRFVMPATETRVEKKVKGEKGEVRIVKEMAKPFTIEGLWGEDEGGGIGTTVVEESMVVEAQA